MPLSFSPNGLSADIPGRHVDDFDSIAASLIGCWELLIVIAVDHPSMLPVWSVVRVVSDACSVLAIVPSFFKPALHGIVDNGLARIAQIGEFNLLHEGCHAQRSQQSHD